MKWTAEEYREYSCKKGKSKYNNRITVVDGIKFQSAMEARYYGYLKMLKASGEVVDFFRQVPYQLPGGVVYKLDFAVVYQCSSIDYVDVKGRRTDMYVLKKKQVEEVHSIKIKEVALKRGAWIEI